MMDLYTEILSALQQEDEVMVATVIQTSGSTPAAALSKMLVTGGGTRLYGTVGGGCVEGDVLRAAREFSATGKAALLRFQLDEDHPESGMLCGGTVHILIEPLTKESVPLVTAIRARRAKGDDFLLATVLGDDGTVRAKFIVFRDEAGRLLTVPEQPEEYIHRILEQEVALAHRPQETARFPLPGGEMILEPVAGTPRLLIFGAGHISKYLVRAASMVGFRVGVVDDRSEFLTPERMREADDTLATEFVDAFDRLEITPSTYIVIVTRGHRSDEDVLRKAISTPAKYVGMIGSRRKVLSTYEHLLAEGVPVEKLERVHAPIGLDIGAVTAEEIGISIAAELIHVRRGEREAIGRKSDGMKPLFAKLNERVHHG